MTNRENAAATCQILQQRSSPTLNSVTFETPAGEASVTTCMQINSQFDYCDSKHPCSNLPELGAIGVQALETPFPTGVARPRRIRDAQVRGNAQEACDDHDATWSAVSRVEARKIDPHEHLAFKSSW